MNPKETQENVQNECIRKATPADAFAITKINYDARRHNYKDIAPQEFLDTLDFQDKLKSTQERFKRWTSVIYVKEIDGKVVGFIGWWLPFDKNVPYDAEIYSIYIDPAIQGKGVGKELMHTIMNDDFFKDKKSFYLWTLEENPQSRGFYEKLWGKVFGTKEHTIGNERHNLVWYYRQK